MLYYIYQALEERFIEMSNLGPAADAALKLWTEALAATERTGMQVRKVCGLPNHAHTFVAGKSRRFWTWLYAPGRYDDTLVRVPGRAFTEAELDILRGL